VRSLFVRSSLTLATAVAFIGCGNEPDPAPPEAPQIESFVASSPLVERGEPVTLSWATKHANAVLIKSLGVVVHESADAQGMFTTAALDITSSFKLFATGEGGEAESTVVVGVSQPDLSIISFEVTPIPAVLGGTATLSWRTDGAEHIRITRGEMAVFEQDVTSQTGTLAVDVTQTSTVYTLDVSAGGAHRTARLPVIAAKAPLINTFEATPSAFNHDTADVTIQWEVVDADTVQLMANDTEMLEFSGAMAGTFSFQVEETTTLTLVAVGAGGSARADQLVSQTPQEVEPNDDVDGATTVDGAVSGSIASATDRDWYRFDVVGGGSVWAEVTDGTGTCQLDASISLIASDGTTYLGQSSFGAGDACATIEPQVAGWARDLDAGTYYVVVESGSTTGDYLLSVRTDSPSCGNGIIERTESCDDGNTDAGDGCNSSCAVESSHAVAGIGQDQTFDGAIRQQGAEEAFALTLPAAAAVSVQLHAPTVGACEGAGPLLSVAVFRADGTLIGVKSGDFDRCATIDPTSDHWAQLAAGDYTLRVGATDVGATIDAYQITVATIAPACGNGVLEASETCDDSNTSGGDGCSASCQFEGAIEAEPNDASTNAEVMTSAAGGAIDPATDVDYWAIDVPDGHHLSAWVTAGSLTRCATNSSLSITLVDRDGNTELAYDSFTGPDGNCGRIDPTNSAAAIALVGGRYFVAVRSAFTEVVPSYFVHFETSAPGCGNAVIDSGEQCDDGNQAAGDGCTASCGFELADSLTPPGTDVSVNPAGDGGYAIIAVDLDTPGQSFEVYTTDGMGACPADTSLELMNEHRASMGTTQYGATGDCAAIQFPFDQFAYDLPIGRYYLKVTNHSPMSASIVAEVRVINARCGDGVLQRRAAEFCDDGNNAAGDGCNEACDFGAHIGRELEPNASRAEANAVALEVGTPKTMAASIDPAVDVDYFSITVPAGAPRMLIATTHDRVGDQLACAIDTLVTLEDDQGMTIVAVDDGNGICGAIDGNTEASASALEAGTYFIRVESFMAFTAYDRYFLTVELR